jgi:Family of unknown function (DUF6152)
MPFNHVDQHANVRTTTRAWSSALLRINNSDLDKVPGAIESSRLNPEETRMTKIVLAFIAAVALVTLSAPVYAHHGFAGRYDEEHPVTVTGTVLELQFENPHSFIIFEVKDANGKAERWTAELASASNMHRVDGWTKNTLKPGDKITIIGPRAKNGAPDMNLSHQSRIVMTDTGKEIHNSIKSPATDN